MNSNNDNGIKSNVLIVRPQINILSRLSAVDIKYTTFFHRPHQVYLILGVPIIQARVIGVGSSCT